MAVGGQKKRPKSGGSNFKLLLIIFLLAAFVVVPGSALIFAAGMIPTVAVSLIDPYRAKFRTRCVGALNFAGTIPFMMALWGGQNSFGQALSLLADPMTWLVMYGAAGMGWMLYSGLPSMGGGFILYNAEQRIATLRGRQKELRSEWGDEVKGGNMSLG